MGWGREQEEMWEQMEEECRKRKTMARMITVIVD